MWPFTRRKEPAETKAQAKIGGQPMHINPTRAQMQDRNVARIARLRQIIAERKAAGREVTGFETELARRLAGKPKRPKEL